MTRRYFLSIDCANKSLAIGIYSVLTNYVEFIKNPNPETINNLIQIHFMKVYDLTPDKKITETDIFIKSLALKKVLQEVIISMNEVLGNDTAESPPQYELLIEYQMNVNDKSRCVYNQIIYEFIDKCKIHTMPPMKKNLIYFHPELKYSNFMIGSSTNYKCNKNHSKYNFLFFINMFDYWHLLKNIKRKNYDDIADTFTQMVAFLIKS